MELRHLRYFVAVAETENVSRAALKLHVSQPALSRQVRDLEDELGCELFERSAKAVRLTEPGRVFLAEARAVLERADEAVKKVRAAASGQREELHVGYAPTLTARILPPALRAFQSLQPGVRVKLHDLATQEMLAKLREGKLQLGLGVRPDSSSLKGLRFEELAREPLQLAVAPTHALARRRSVPLADAARLPLITYSRSEYPDYHGMLEEIFSHARLHIQEEHDGVSSLVSAVEAGSGVAVVPQSLTCIAGVRLKLVPLSPQPKPLIVGILSPKDGVSAAAQSFIDVLRPGQSEVH